MNKIIMICGVIFLMLSMFLSGCNESGISIDGDGSKLVGTWRTDSVYDALTLNSNGKCKKFTYDGTWFLEDEKLVINYEVRNKPYEYTYYYSFSDNNNTLSLTNIDSGYTIIYSRK